MSSPIDLTRLFEEIITSQSQHSQHNAPSTTMLINTSLNSPLFASSGASSLASHSPSSSTTTTTLTAHSSFMPTTGITDDTNTNHTSNDNSNNNNDNDADNNDTTSTIMESPTRRQRRLASMRALPHLPCHLCSERFHTSAERTRHIAQFHDTTGKNEKCEICGARFAKKNQMRKHVAKIHVKQVVVVVENQQEEAGESEKKSVVTQQQIDAILKSMPYECTHCDKKFATEGQFKKHLKRHEEMRFICGFPNCGKTFAFRKEMQIHLHQCHKYQTEEDQEKENVGYSCPVCAAAAHSSHHSQQQESQEQHLDNVQKQHTFASLELLQHHLREAHAREDEPMFRCPYDGCLKVYTRQSNLNTHIRTSHGDEEEKFKFPCTFCHRRFCHKRSLNQHVQQEHSYEEESQLKKRQRK